ncbi:MAG: 2-oxoacid:acceptor oxidoreductase subunit alpha [Candidatus Methanoperedens sp.]|nr:2-oxoacid:acceptor oxidoreductase subunit alpha [Candidatus Methanoperedens sp.]MCZ7396851.1 2-oxoacid:acceptor oxidoreductase subunit alpha [Candidatus Methanoperedens sp.]
MEKNRLTWKIGGKAGEGIMATGIIFSQSCSRGGLHVFDINEYPSLIKGGHNTVQVRVEDREIFSQVKGVDVLIALNKETIFLHKDEITTGGGIIYDSAEIIERKELREDIRLYPVPFGGIIKEIGAQPIMKNNLALGASIALIDYDFEILASVIRDMFQRKGDKIINENISAAKAGFDYVKKNFPDDFNCKLETIGKPGRMLLTGNDAICMGAIKAGCKFYSAYPMTPASSILHFMAAQERRFNIVVKHTEDEISAINMAIGAGFAGVRAMCGTSGGGFCLMSEGYGLAGMIEIPVVIIMAMRPGPSTGMPTWSEQGDFKFVLSASQGDFPRPVLVPGNNEECFYLTAEAFNIAEKYQTPVIVLTDKYLAESHKTTEKFDAGRITIDRGLYAQSSELAASPEATFFKRYKFTENGISPRTIPGTKKGLYTATSDDHDEEGNISEEIEDRINMMQKRMRKLDALAKELKHPDLIGPKDATVTIIAAGSTKGPIKEAMMLLEKEGVKSNYLQILYLNPFPSEKVSKVIDSAKKTVVVENNFTGQLADIIREKTGKSVDKKILKYDGRPFYPEEIHSAIKEVVSHG